MAGVATTNIPRFATGYAAMILSSYFLYAGENLPVFLASAFFLLICATDTHLSQIPNAASLVMALAGLGYQFATAGVSGLATAVLGMVTGLGLLIIPYLMGGMGAGDVKALAALGALLGPAVIFQVFLYTGLIGGVMAVLHYAFNRNLIAKCVQGLKALRIFAYTRNPGDLKPEPSREKLRFPYAAAIAFGFFAYLNWGALV